MPSICQSLKPQPRRPLIRGPRPRPLMYHMHPAIEGGDAEAGGEAEEATDEEEGPLRGRAVAKGIVRSVIGEGKGGAGAVGGSAGGAAVAGETAVEVAEQVADSAVPARHGGSRLRRLGVGIRRREAGSEEGLVVVDLELELSGRHEALALALDRHLLSD